MSVENRCLKPGQKLTPDASDERAAHLNDYCRNAPWITFISESMDLKNRELTLSGSDGSMCRDGTSMATLWILGRKTRGGTIEWESEFALTYLQAAALHRVLGKSLEMFEKAMWRDSSIKEAGDE